MEKSEKKNHSDFRCFQCILINIPCFISPGVWCVHKGSINRKVARLIVQKVQV
jgi:hypothetical protein